MTASLRTLTEKLSETEAKLQESQTAKTQLEVKTSDLRRQLADSRRELQAVLANKESQRSKTEALPRKEVQEDTACRSEAYYYLGNMQKCEIYPGQEKAKNQTAFALCDYINTKDGKQWCHLLTKCPSKNQFDCVPTVAYVELLKSTDISQRPKICPNEWTRNWTTGECLPSRPPRWTERSESIDSRSISCDTSDVECLQRGKSVACEPGSNRHSYESTTPAAAARGRRTVWFHCN
jgi:hypothetical protein